MRRRAVILVGALVVVDSNRWGASAIPSESMCVAGGERPPEVVLGGLQLVASAPDRVGAG
jgi:hypothetical protein